MSTRPLAFGLCQQVSGALSQCLRQQIRFASRQTASKKLAQSQAAIKDSNATVVSPFIASLLTPNMTRQSVTSSAVKPTDSTTSTSTPILIQHQITPDEYRLVTEDLAATISDSSTTWAKDKSLANQQAEQIRRIIGINTASAKELVKWNTRNAVDTFSRKQADTGSPEVQAAVWTVRIRNLERHMEGHRKDVHNRRTYRMLIHKRAKMLRYLKRESLERYHRCLDSLSLKPGQVEGEIVVP